MRKALTCDFPARLESAHRPRTISENWPAGLNFRASSASGLAMNSSPTQAMIPATNEAIAQIARATPARPCLAIW